MSNRKTSAEKALKSAIDSIRPFLDKASEAAHEIKTTDHATEEDAWFDGVMELGFVTTGAATLCPAALKVLNEVIILLHHSHEDEGDEDEGDETESEKDKDSSRVVDLMQALHDSIDKTVH
jgi:hypothetical protein